MSNVRISPAVRVATAFAALALAINVGLFVVGSRRTWTDFALPVLIIGSLIAMSHPRLRESRLTIRIYYPISAAVALAVLASSMWHILHPR